MDGRATANASPSLPLPLNRPNGSVNYTYDAMNRVTSAKTLGTACTSVSGGTLYWKGTGSEALVESSATNTNPTRYIFFHDKRIARLDPGATTAKYYVQDNVGSTALVTDTLGNPLSESLFFPYGGEQAILANDSNTYKFTGKQRDPETGLDDFGARHYASNLGRFVSPDWAAKPVTVPYATFGDPQTLNLYSYVENGPLNRVDADGHAASQGGDNNWLGFDEGPCAGTWSLYCIEETHKDNLGSDSMGSEAQDEAAYDAMVAASQQGASQSQSSSQTQSLDTTAQREQAAQQTQTALTNVIYNETSAFSPDPKAKSGATGSAEDLHNGRVAVGEVAEGILTGKHPERVLAKTELSKGEAAAIKAGYGPAVAAYADAKAAAAQVLAGSNTTNGATQYRTRFSSDVTTNVGRDGPKVPGTPVSQHFGPFTSSLGGSGIGVIVVAP